MLVILIHDSCLLINVVSVICYSYDHKFIIHLHFPCFRERICPLLAGGFHSSEAFKAGRRFVHLACMLSSIGNSESETPKFGINTLDLPPKPVTVTTRIITFLVVNPYKPLFAPLTGLGVDPINMPKQSKSYRFSKLNFVSMTKVLGLQQKMNVS